VDRKDVTSPTFLLIQEYAGRLPLYHFDTYRLRDSDEFLELGADELIHGSGVCLIEWADRVADVLPRDLLRIEIETTGPTSRRFAFAGTGPRSSGLADRLDVQLRTRPQPGMNTERGNNPRGP
jgi:tRNA threonylcarbamoyladenosine biosynthesis protein TsaE